MIFIIILLTALYELLLPNKTGLFCFIFFRIFYFFLLLTCRTTIVRRAPSVPLAFFIPLATIKRFIFAGIIGEILVYGKMSIEKFSNWLTIFLLPKRFFIIKKF